MNCKLIGRTIVEVLIANDDNNHPERTKVAPDRIAAGTVILVLDDGTEWEIGAERDGNVILDGEPYINPDRTPGQPRTGN